MARYELSKEADNDISAIAQFTLDHWSDAQVDRYLLGLHAKLERLAAKPNLGILADDLRAGYRRYRYRSHMVFFKATSDGIFVVRILHAQADYVRHL